MTKMYDHVFDGLPLNSPEFAAWCGELRNDLTLLDLMTQAARDAFEALDKGVAPLYAVKRLQAIAEPMDLKDLVHRLKDAEEGAALICGQPVALLIGTTGCGKSTTVQFLGNIDFTPHRAEDGKLRLRATMPVPDAFAGINVSAAGASETKNIHPVILTWKSPRGQRTLYICDSPG